MSFLLLTDLKKTSINGDFPMRDDVLQPLYVVDLMPFLNLEYFFCALAQFVFYDLDWLYGAVLLSADALC